MKNSIRTKITFMFIVFASFIVVASWVLSNYFLEDIIVYNVKKNLKATYQSCNTYFDINENLGGESDLYGRIYNPTDSTVLIFDRINSNIYTSINDESKMMDSLNSALRAMDDSKIVSKSIYANYVITKNHDESINADYYDLIGVLDNGFNIIVRTPVARIDSIVLVMKEVFTRIAIGLLVFGSVFILSFSNIFAKPIKNLCNVAKRMTNLDFSAKAQVYTRDEIGELGHSMNEMSEKLEATISKLKSANIKLEKDIKEKEQVDDMRKEFLSHVSHELKTPIALIQGYAEGLKDIADDPESRDFYTEVIVDEAKKMNSLVMKLLNLNELEFGTVNINIEQFELASFISTLIASSKILYEDSDIEVEFDESGPIYVWADEYMIEEVFTNYFVNAVHHVTPGGKIKVFFEKRENDIRVNVFNHGDPIPDEDIDKLFDKFYKVDKARTREYGGSGIGLSIVAATMKAHNKSYGVYNTDDGVVFYFDLDANMP